MGCNACKKKPEPITSLSTEVSFNRIKQAHNYLSIVSKMNEVRWDYVEDVYLELYPTKSKILRTCSDCLRNVAKAIEYEYNKRLNP